LAIGLLFGQTHKALAENPSMPSVFRLEKKLHPNEGAAHQPGVPLPFMGRLSGGQ
jgi:hypothetical protein